MTKPFNTLCAELEKALKLGDRRYQGAERYMRGIDLIRQAIGKLRVLGARYLQNSAREVEYFREVWPVFYGKLFFYIRLYKIELRRETTCIDAWQEVIAGEEAGVQAFFRRNREFWQYYRSGSPAIAEQFTRAYSAGLIFEPLALVVDPEGGTLVRGRLIFLQKPAGDRAERREIVRRRGPHAIFAGEVMEAVVIKYVMQAMFTIKRVFFPFLA